MLRNKANEKVGSFGEREPIEKKDFIRLDQQGKSIEIHQHEKFFV